MQRILSTSVLALSALFAGVSGAQEPPLKIGVIGPFSGPSYESGGAALDLGIKAFFKVHGETVAGRSVEIIRRDVPEPMPDLAKRVATELVVKDKVDFLAGIIFTPNALAVGQVSGATKTPLIIMNAATSGIMARIPNAVRLSFSLSQVTAPLGNWAAKNGSQRAMTIVADYAPGIDAETTFVRTFTEGGGQILQSLRVPLANVEFSSYVRRVRDAKADAVYLFLPNGDAAKSFLKAFTDGGLAQAGVKVFADGGVTAPNNLPIMGENAIGLISSHHYTETHESTENQKFVKTFTEISNGQLPTYISVGAYDGMAAIYKAVQDQAGKPTLEGTMQSLKNLKLEGPRGPVAIDPSTRDVVQNVYIRRVERRDGKLVNVEVATVPTVKP